MSATSPWLFYSQDFLQHKTAGHPESPERLRTVLRTLEDLHLHKALKICEAKPIALDFLQRMHHPAYLQELEQFCQQAGEGMRIDENSVASTGTYRAAFKAAGAAIALVEALTQNTCPTAFSLARPPGHHAMPHYSMGFCFFNNIALAALYALEHLGLKRVAILDWDAHHGNGTEYLFYRDPRVFFVSWHQDPNWPGSGKIEDMGEGPGWGYNLNIPLPLHCGETAFLSSFQALVAPALTAFAPQVILVSAGYDAHFADPLTQMGMTATGFARMTETVMQSAEDLNCQVGFFLEGGYHPQALANSVAATLKTLLHQEAHTFPEELGSAPESELSLDSLYSKISLEHPLLNVSKKETQP